MAVQRKMAAFIFGPKLPLRIKGLVALGIVATILNVLPTAQGQTYTVLHTFSGQGDGSSPLAGPTIDRAGNLYGTTTGFITGGNGTVFKLSRAGSGWILHTLYTFQAGTDGRDPQARVVFGPDGSLYGTTTNGGLGFGTVFNLRPAATVCPTVQCSWTETVLYRFTGGSDGAYPQYGDLTFDAAGNIYGTASGGGGGCGEEGCGVVFELSRSGSGWTESVLYSFNGGSAGSAPYSGVTFDNAGNLYGTTTLTAAVYELSPSLSGWTENTLYHFQNDQAYGDLVYRQGSLYGTTFNGTVYEMYLNGGRWNYELLYGGVGAGLYATPAFDASGNLYAAGGASVNFGFVFELSPGSNGWTYTELFNYNDAPFSDGFSPTGGVVLDASGNLYGTTFEGGDQNCGEGCGVVWQLTP